MLSLGETRTEKTHTTTDNTHQPTITTARAASSHTTHARLPPSLFSSPSRARRRTTSHGDDDDGEAKRQRRGEVGADGVRGGGRFARAVTQNRRRRRRRHHRHPRLVEVTRSVLVKKTTFSTLHTQTTSRGSLQNKRAMLLCAKRVRSMLSHLVKRFHLSNAFLYVFGLVRFWSRKLVDALWWAGGGQSARLPLRHRAHRFKTVSFSLQQHRAGASHGDPRFVVVGASAALVSVHGGNVHRHASTR